MMHWVGREVKYNVPGLLFLYLKVLLGMLSECIFEESDITVSSRPTKVIFEKLNQVWSVLKPKGRPFCFVIFTQQWVRLGQNLCDGPNCKIDCSPCNFFSSPVYTAVYIISNMKLVYMYIVHDYHFKICHSPGPRVLTILW